MNAFWVSLKENVKCGSKLADVVTMRHQPAVKSGQENRNMNNRNDNNHDHSNPPQSQASLVPTIPKLRELSIGDPSRKIVEMIFDKAWMNTSSPQRKVRTVFKVNISPETLERFEKYREMVKKKACEQKPINPRSIVDGNELLRFYGTTMRCCCCSSQGRKSAQKVKSLCNDPSCSVCQIIQFNFDTEFSRISSAKVKTERRAVIICRIIAGTAIHEVNGQIEGSSCSNGVGKMQFSLEKFVVRNPSAILPCFVLVFD